jgi:hypothetical protein
MVQNNQYKVLTPSGYQLFSGVIRSSKQCLEIVTETNTLSCSEGHKIFVDDDNTTLAGYLNIGDTIKTKNGVESIASIRSIGKQVVYDLVNVDNGSKYYTNDILSHNCVFLQKGESSIDAELFEKFKSMCSDAVLILQDGKYKIWKMPQDNRLYIAGVDIAEGIGQDYSVVQILDITDLTNIEQVACFRSNDVDVPNFTTQLHEILTQWGKPLAMIERNNCGAQVVDNLYHMHKYENIINYGAAVAGRKKEQLGVVAHTNTKHKGVINMRYWVNELQCIRFNDVNTIQELKEFVRKPNGTWSARGSCKDDCVMSLIWALMALDNDANNGICQRYFEILSVDDNGKPSAIKGMDFGLKYYTRPVNALAAYAQDADAVAPICFGNDSMQVDEVQDLIAAGWTSLM